MVNDTMKNNRNPEEIEDLKISIAIISSTVILTIQYFILISFNLMATPNASIIQLLSKTIVGIIFLYTLPTVLKRKKVEFIVVYYVAIFILLIHYLLFPENQEHMIEMIFPLFFMCLPVFIYTLSLKNWTILKKVMKKASLIIFLFGLLSGIQILMNNEFANDYSMALSYYMLLPTILFLDELLDRFSLKALFITCFSLLIILAIGSRGPILCSGIFIILKLIRPASKLNFSKVVIYMCYFLFAIFTILYFKKILLTIDDFLSKYNIDSRNISLFLNDYLHLSGRDQIYEKILTEIAQHPFLGIGIAGDRRVADGNYAHNIILEIFLNFGVIIGLILVIAFIMWLLKLLFVKDLNVYNMMIIWISLGFVSLLVSGSYLIDVNFWALLGLMISQLKMNIGNPLKQTGEQMSECEPFDEYSVKWKNR